MSVRRRSALVLASCIALFTAACGSDSKSDSAATTAAAPASSAAATTAASTDAAAPSTEAAAPASEAAPVEMTKLSLGAVPVLDLGVIGIGREQGIFEKAGIDVEITFADGGPAVVTGVVSGQFDIGYTAWTPPLLVVAGGQPLRMVTGVAGVGPEGSNSMVLVKPDSGIKGFGDLNGKKVATNAPRSVLSLLTVMAVTQGGGDGNSVEIVPLPFGEIARAVAEGTVDAGVTVEPFVAEALATYPDLVKLGDLSGVVEEAGDPATLIFSSEGTMSKKADAIARFQAAFAEAADYANQHPDDLRRLGAEITDVPSAAAEKMPVSPMVVKVDPARLQPLLDAMVAYKWVEKPIDLTAFFG